VGEIVADASLAAKEVDTKKPFTISNADNKRTLENKKIFFFIFLF